MKNLIIVFLVFSTIGNIIRGQQDKVIFSVNDKPVYLSEFKYIYDKTNGEKADYSRASIDEYLDLYTKFKTKVEFARVEKIDTIPSLQKELEKYSKQLSDSYLIDKEVVERLAREIYERQQFDVEVGHIMVAFPKKAQVQDTLAAWNKVNQIKKDLNKGRNFELLANEFSDDPSAKKNKGKIGFLTAKLPNGFYKMEQMIYSLKPGQTAGPVRTVAGYHLIKVYGKRPARGQIEAAPILIRDTKKKPNPQASILIKKAFEELKAGKQFSSVVKNYSQDEKTKNNAGYIGFFGINKYDKGFEDATFSIMKDRQYSKPFLTSAGWHIVQRLSKKTLKPFEEEKLKLIEQVKKDTRFEDEKYKMVSNIKKEYNFKENKKIVNAYLSSLDESFTIYKWKPKDLPVNSLFSVNGVEYTTKDFDEFNKLETRLRLQKGQNSNLQETGKFMYNSFTDYASMKEYKKLLPSKYPELKALLREYEEGILLFEITKQYVWEKANKDTVGLKVFYNENIKDKNKYMWKDRAKIVFYELNKNAASFLPKLRKWVNKKSSEYISSKINTKGNKYLMITRETFEKGKNKDIDALVWKDKYLSPTLTTKKGDLKFMKVEKIIPKVEKKLKEARGYIVAEYQDYLEKIWLETLKKQFVVKVNQDVLNSIIE